MLQSQSYVGTTPQVVHTRVISSMSRNNVLVNSINKQQSSSFNSQKKSSNLSKDQRINQQSQEIKVSDSHPQSPFKPRAQSLGKSGDISFPNSS